jgi:predicted NAD-dependent protein-ADP-ribosyltransferase YbiA (DUF1768 family)
MQKTLDLAWRETIRLKQSPLWARQSTKTKSFPIRDGWAGIKVGVMRDLLEQKFTRQPKLAAKLIATGDRIIAEGNDWNDRRWRACQGADGVWHVGNCGGFGDSASDSLT